MKKILLIALMLLPSTAFAQAGRSSLCVTTNGTNCVPVSSSNPFPVTNFGGVGNTTAIVNGSSSGGAAVKPANTSAIASDPALVVSMSPNTAIVIGPSPNASAALSHVSGASASISALSVKATTGNLYAFNCTAISGTTAGYCVAYASATTPAAGALTPGSVLDFCYMDNTAKGCSLSRIPMGASYLNGIQVLITSAATPYTYTTGTLTGAISADFK